MRRMDGRGPNPYPEVRTDWGEIQKTGTTLLRLAAGITGIVLIVTGAVLALNVFGLVRGIVESPEALATYLDSWETVLETPEPAEEAAEAPDAEEEVAAEVADPETFEEEPRHRHVEQREGDWLLGLGEVLIEAVHSGTLARPCGALLMLLFAILLARIPFSFVTAGSRLVGALPPVKRKKNTMPDEDEAEE